MKAAFPVSEWVDQWLKEKYGITIYWDSSKMVDNGDYDDLEITFDIKNVHGGFRDILIFLRDFDLYDEEGADVE